MCTSQSVKEMSDLASIPLLQAGTSPINSPLEGNMASTGTIPTLELTMTMRFEAR